MFYLFAGYTYYPRGGFSDFKGSFDDFESAAIRLQLLTEDADAGYGDDIDWFQIVKVCYDGHKVVCSSDYDHDGADIYEKSAGKWIKSEGRGNEE